MGLDVYNEAEMLVFGLDIGTTRSAGEFVPLRGGVCGCGYSSRGWC